MQMDSLADLCVNCTPTHRMRSRIIRTLLMPDYKQPGCLGTSKNTGLVRWAHWEASLVSLSLQ